MKQTFFSRTYMRVFWSETTLKEPSAKFRAELKMR